MSGRGVANPRVIKSITPHPTSGRRVQMPKPLYNHSIIDHPMQCTCGWYGIIGDCLFDIDDDGGIGCPVCSKIVSEQPGQVPDNPPNRIIPPASGRRAYIHPTETCHQCGLPVFFYPQDGGLKCWNPECRLNRERYENTLSQDIATNEIVQPGVSQSPENKE